MFSPRPADPSLALPRVVRPYCLLAGACDTLTGILLIAVPLATLRLMGVPDTPTDIVYLRFLGAFVTSVGFLYLYPFLRPGGRRPVTWLAVLELTAVVRAGIALFVGGAVAAGALSMPWLSVALTDGALAAVQGVFLYRSGGLRAG